MDDSSLEFDSPQRYSRQVRFAPLGQAGQDRLRTASAAFVGCGALGSVIANLLVRAGVGHVRLIDRDLVELSNLQRQSLFDENDVAQGLPKAVAAANRLAQINRGVNVEPMVVDVNSKNVQELCQGADVILDGTDNFDIRFLIYHLSIATDTPWVYGGCLGAEGQTMTIVPGQTACLNCLMLDGPPPPGTTPTCDSFGILAPIINVIGAMQAMEALKILSGNAGSVSRQLRVVSLWDNQLRQLDVSGLAAAVDCPTCDQKQFQWLDGKRETDAVVLCGRDAVQLRFPQTTPPDLAELARRLTDQGQVVVNEYLLRYREGALTLSLFLDGRAIVSGTGDPSVARALYTRCVGH